MDNDPGIAKLCNDTVTQIAASFTGSTGEQNQVGSPQSFPDPVAQTIGIVTNNASEDRDAALLANSIGQNLRVRIVNRRGAHLVTGRYDFVAC